MVFIPKNINTKTKLNVFGSTKFLWLVGHSWDFQTSQKWKGYQFVIHLTRRITSDISNLMCLKIAPFWPEIHKTKRLLFSFAARFITLSYTSLSEFKQNYMGQVWSFYYNSLFVFRLALVLHTCFLFCGYSYTHVSLCTHLRNLKHHVLSTVKGFSQPWSLTAVCENSIISIIFNG